MEYSEHILEGLGAVRKDLADLSVLLMLLQMYAWIVRAAFLVYSQ